MGSDADVQGSSVLMWTACLSFPAEMGEVAAVMYDGMQRARPPGQGSLIMPNRPSLLAQSAAGAAQGNGGNTARRHFEPAGRTGNGELANNLGTRMGTK